MYEEAVQNPYGVLDNPGEDGVLHLNLFLAHVQSGSRRDPHGPYLCEERMMKALDDALALLRSRRRNPHGDRSISEACALANALTEDSFKAR